MREIDWTVGMLHSSYSLGLVSKHDVNDLGPALRPLTRKEHLKVVWKLAPPERLVELQLTPEKLDHWVDISWSLIKCAKAYNPSGSVCKSYVFRPPLLPLDIPCLSPAAVDVFYAIPLRGSMADLFNNLFKPWSGFSRGEPSYTNVPGEHYTLMDLDYVPQFQEIFRGRLKARGL